MHLIPDTQIGLYNAWIFSAVYGALSIGIMISLPNKKRKRIVTLPKFNSKTEKIAVGITSLIFARGLIFYSVFVPLKMYTVSFYIGSAVYLAGMISSVYAMWSFSRVDLSGPVTGGNIQGYPAPDAGNEHSNVDWRRYSSDELDYHCLCCFTGDIIQSVVQGTGTVLRG